jgi:sugar (pentulose or hexulose) kinase
MKEEVKRPHVTFVGGVHRLQRTLQAVAQRVGVEVEVHDGHVRGNGAATLAACIRRSTAVVVVTGVNSHNAVQTAKREAEKYGVAVHILKFCGNATARELLESVKAA